MEYSLCNNVIIISGVLKVSICFNILYTNVIVILIVLYSVQGVIGHKADVTNSE